MLAVLILKLNNMMEKKIVLITGASSGIGEGCARKFAMNGYRLILNGRNVEKLNAVKKELLEKYGADVYLFLSMSATGRLPVPPSNPFRRNGRR